MSDDNDDCDDIDDPNDDKDDANDDNNGSDGSDGSDGNDDPSDSDSDDNDDFFVFLPIFRGWYAKCFGELVLIETLLFLGNCRAVSMSVYAVYVICFIKPVFKETFPALDDVEPISMSKFLCS